MGLSWWHILLVLLVFVLLFGTGKISGLMGYLAKGIKSFKKEMTEEGAEAEAEPEPARPRLSNTNLPSPRRSPRPREAAKAPKSS